MKLIVDNRERGLIDLLGEHEVEQLDLADVQIREDDDHVLFYIERKTTADLASSIKDGRYKEQKMRLLSTVSSTNQGTPAQIIYIIEGRMSYNEDAYYFGLSNKTLISSVIHSSLRDNIKIFNTNSLIETANLIDGLYKRIEKLKATDGQYVTATTATSYMEACIKPQKKANITATSVLLGQLCAIPNISVKKAQLISDHFKCTSIYSILKQVEFDRDKFGKALLGINGVGKVIAQTVTDHLFGKEEN